MSVMSSGALFALDVAAIGLVVFGLYFPRHRRRDLLVAYLVVNLGVLAVADLLSSTSLGAGLGLGLFGVLSIIRLRSAELDQAEIAYYFGALALGLLAGIGGASGPLAPLLMLAIVAALAIGDHPRLYGGYRHQTVKLDRAIADEAALITHLEGLLGGRVLQVRVRNLDLVQDTTVVEARYRLGTGESRTPTVPSSAAVGR